jgi:hypothetical protein
VDKGKKVTEDGRVEQFHGDYGTDDVPIITSTMEGPHGFSNIIGRDEVPTGMFNYSGLDAPVKKRRSNTGS